MERNLQNRSARYTLNIPVEYLYEGRIVLGRCINISDSGLLAHFDEPLDLWTTGELRLHAGLRSCKLPARVARVHEREAGLIFRINGNAAASAHYLSLIDNLIQEACEAHGTINPPF